MLIILHITIIALSDKLLIIAVMCTTVYRDEWRQDIILSAVIAEQLVCENNAISHTVVAWLSNYSLLFVVGWVNELVGGQHPGANGFMFFGVNVDLTEEGIGNQQ